MTAGRPRLGVSLSGADPRFLMSVAPLVDFLEVDPEVVAEYKNGRPRIQPRALELISDAAGRVPIVVHGTDLSIGSHNGYSTDYLRLLDELLTVVTPYWHRTFTDSGDPYLAAVAGSRGLMALMSIDLFWKEHSLLQRCPFTAGLMRTKGVLRQEVTRLIRDEVISAFIEEMALLFLGRAAQHPEPLVATLARFESALAAGAEGDPTEHRIEWEQDPYYVLGCLVENRAIEPSHSRGRFVTVVCPAIENRFRVESSDR